VIVLVIVVVLGLVDGQEIDDEGRRRGRLWGRRGNLLIVLVVVVVLGLLMAKKSTTKDDDEGEYGEDAVISRSFSWSSSFSVCWWPKIDDEDEEDWELGLFALFFP
jgi:hypothetical protein